MTTLPLFPKFDESKAKAIVVYHSPDGDIETRLDVENKTVWQTQKQIAANLHITPQSVGQSVKRFKEERGEAANSSIKSDFIVTSDGKQRSVEHYDLTLIAYIGFKAKANERVIAFQNWVGEKLKEATARPTDPILEKRNQAVTAYQLKGFSPEQAQRRVDTKESHALLTSTLKATHEEHKPSYRDVLKAQNEALFNFAKNQIVDYLGLLPKQADNLRDHLGKYALQAIDIANRRAAKQMAILGRELTSDEQKGIVIDAARKVAIPLREIATLDDVDFVSGAPLDEHGKALIVRNVRLLK